MAGSIPSTLLRNPLGRFLGLERLQHLPPLELVATTSSVFPNALVANTAVVMRNRVRRTNEVSN